MEYYHILIDIDYIQYTRKLSILIYLTCLLVCCLSWTSLSDILTTEYKSA